MCGKAASHELPFRHVFHGQLLGREFAVWRADDRFVNIELNGFVLGKTVTPQTSQYGRELLAPDRNNFGPRFGFAWRPFSDNRTAVRGSYGIFSEAPNENSYTVGVNNTPYLVRQSITNDVTNPKYYWSTLFPIAPPVDLVPPFSDQAWYAAYALHQQDRSLRPAAVRRISRN